MLISQTGTDSLEQNTSGWQWKRKGKKLSQKAALTCGKAVSRSLLFDTSVHQLLEGAGAWAMVLDFDKTGGHMLQDDADTCTHDAVSLTNLKVWYQDIHLP